MTFWNTISALILNGVQKNFCFARKKHALYETRELPERMRVIWTLLRCVLCPWCAENHSTLSPALLHLNTEQNPAEWLAICPCGFLRSFSFLLRRCFHPATIPITHDTCTLSAAASHGVTVAEVTAEWCSNAGTEWLGYRLVWLAITAFIWMWNQCSREAGVDYDMQQAGEGDTTSS